MKTKNHVFYNNQTGEIYFIKKLSHAQAENNCRLNRNFNMSCILESELGGIVNKITKKINLSTMTLEDRIIPTVPVSYRIRQKRNSLLKTSDWTQVPDGPLTDAKKAEWATYRQALRDLDIDSYSSVKSVVWPTPPA